MEEILHQLRLVVYPVICRVLYIPGGAGFLASTVWCFSFKDLFEYQHLVMTNDHNEPMFSDHPNSDLSKTNAFIRLIKHETWVNRWVTMHWCNVWLQNIEWKFNLLIMIIVLMLKILQARSSNQWYTQTTWLRWVFLVIGEWLQQTKHTTSLTTHVHSWPHKDKIIHTHT